MSDRKLRSSLIRLAHAKPELRGTILPLLKQSSQKQARSGFMYTSDIKDAALELVKASRDPSSEIEDETMPFLDLVSACEEYARRGIRNVPVATLFSKIADALLGITEEEALNLGRTAALSTHLKSMKSSILTLLDTSQPLEQEAEVFKQLLNSAAHYAKENFKNQAVFTALENAKDKISN